mgnify:FL=1
MLVVAFALCCRCEWVPGIDAECMQHLCIPPLNLTWVVGTDRTSSSRHHFDGNAACKLLLDRGYKKIDLIGDSLIRHLSQAFQLLFTGNYESGSIFDKFPICMGTHQFDRICSGKHRVSWPITYCNGQLEFEYHLLFKQTITPNMLPLSNRTHLVIWGEGSHPVDFVYHQTPSSNNNATRYREKITSVYGFCNSTDESGAFRAVLPSGDSAGVQQGEAPPGANLFWLSPHQRPQPGNQPSESYEIIRQFTSEMREFFVGAAPKRKCANVHYVDVFTMTDTLVSEHARSVGALMVDGLHFHRSVNLLKVQLLLHYIERSGTSVAATYAR